MALNFNMMVKLKKAWDVFSANHPKVPPFVTGVGKKGIKENMEIAVAIRYPDGEEFKTGIRLTQSDIEQLEILKSLKEE